jgi:hypothetical protein
MGLVTKEAVALVRLELATKEAVALARLESLERLLKAQDALIKEKDSHLTFSLNAQDALIKEKDSRLTFSLMAQDALNKEKDSRLKEKDAHLQSRERTFAREMAAMTYSLDTANGKIESRAVLEVILPNIWKSIVIKKNMPTGTSNQLAELLKEGTCPGLIAYLKQAAEDNGVREVDLLRQTGKLYNVLCEYLHSEALGGTSRLPAVLFNQPGHAMLVAFAALASFSGRDLSLYHLGGDVIPLKLRALRGSCSATQEEVRASDLMEERMVGVKEIPLLQLK